MSARRRLGQHFLVDRRAVRRIVDALSLRPGESLLEIGPGGGALTGALLEAGGRLVAVELDGDLAARLRERFAGGDLEVLQRDILEVDLAALAGPAPAPGLVVVGNLPYGVSKPIAMKLVRQRAAVDRAVLMFQLEVAERLVAAPGSKSYGPLSVLTDAAYRVEKLFELSPGAFRPPPEVRSAVTRWVRRPLSALPPAEASRLMLCLAACFARRRQTLRNNLRARLRSGERVDRLLHEAGLDGALRAERVEPAGFRRLAALWPDDEPGGKRDSPRKTDRGLI